MYRFFEKMFRHEQKYIGDMLITPIYKLNWEWYVDFNYITAEVSNDGREQYELIIYHNSKLYRDFVYAEEGWSDIERLLQKVRQQIVDVHGEVPDRVNQFFMECTQYISAIPVQREKKQDNKSFWIFEYWR
jgi:hypothetical protein